MNHTDAAMLAQYNALLGSMILGSLALIITDWPNDDVMKVQKVIEDRGREAWSLLVDQYYPPDEPTFFFFD